MSKKEIFQEPNFSATTGKQQGFEQITNSILEAFFRTLTLTSTAVWKFD